MHGLIRGQRQAGFRYYYFLKLTFVQMIYVTAAYKITHRQDSSPGHIAAVLCPNGLQVCGYRLQMTGIDSCFMLGLGFKLKTAGHRDIVKSTVSV